MNSKEQEIEKRKILDPLIDKIFGSSRTPKNNNKVSKRTEALAGRISNDLTSIVKMTSKIQTAVQRNQESILTKPVVGVDTTKAVEILNNMLSFMQKSREQDTQDFDTQYSFNEMNEYADADRHREIMDVFTQATKKKRQAEKNMARGAKARKPVAPQAPAPKPAAPAPKPAAPAPQAPAPKPAAPAPKPAAPAPQAPAPKPAAPAPKPAAPAPKPAAPAPKPAAPTPQAPAPKPAAPAPQAPAPKPAAPAPQAPAPKPAAPTAKPAAPAKQAPTAKPVKTPAPPAAPSAAVQTIKEGAKTATRAAVIVGVAALTQREALAANIAKYESGEKGYNAYNRGDFWLAKGKTEGAYLKSNDIDFSKMTINDYLKRTNKKLNAGGLLDASDPNVLFAVGKYQLIPGTMKVMAKKLGLDPDKTYLTPEIQDMLFAKGLTTKGNGGRFAVDDYISGKEGATKDAAILALAMEFASVGVPYDIKAKSLFENTLPKVDLKKGETFYKKPGGFNKAHNPPEAVGAALDADRESKTKLVTNNTTVGSSLNDSSVNNADMRKDLSQQSSGTTVLVNQNNTNNQQKTVVVNPERKEELNPTMRR
jgi:hypothetical protein